ncbi:MAG: D-tyrosyl-tRNA(Tyr) deacylase [Candidatus Omnitrophica bacterium]|nr:D-tyrosyl-tRNA(Tyr) deacylase [Candidatus Omnitrophota bacterium]
MRLVVQRVTKASVTVNHEVLGRIGRGLVVMVGISETDTPEAAPPLAERLVSLRIFEDDQGKMNLSAGDVGAGFLVIPAFTVYAGTERGRRPDFTSAARPESAEPIFEHFLQALRSSGLQVETGRFRSHMDVELLNDGPVCISLESK